MKPQRERFQKLDGLRGVLSVMVAMNHSFLVLAIPAFADVWGQNLFVWNSLQSKLQQIFMVFGNGGVAVTLFFVMSGFVLVQSAEQWNGTVREAINFYIKRFLRLYPVFLLILILTTIYMRTVFHYEKFEAGSTWFHWHMNFSMDLMMFLKNLTMYRLDIGGVTWTLRVIIVVSALFPILFQLSKRLNRWFNLAVIVALIVLSFGPLKIQNFRDLRYLYMFYLGFALPQFRDLFEKIKPFAIKIVTPFLILLLLDVRYMTSEYVGGLIESFIAFLIIGVLAYGDKTGIFSVLENRVWQYLGRISYSLYLVHFSVLYLLARVILENVNPSILSGNYFIFHTGLLVVSLAISIFISELVYRYVETPSHSLSKKIKI